MNIISRKFHAILDYLSSIAFLALPWILNFNDLATPTSILFFSGLIVFTLSILTNYEGGLFRSIPMAVHLNMDILLGILLIASPWLFGFSDKVYLPHVIMGLLALLAGLMTVRRSLNKRANG